MKNYIFAGRFQPFHIGHLQVLEFVSNNFNSQDNLIVGVVSPFISNKVIDKEFVDLALEHHLPERNPWSVSERLKALSILTRELSLKYNLNIVTSAIPRPDYGYETIKEWFPEKRIWIIPNAGESFDESKANFFLERGDEVLRINDDSKISGFVIRTAIKNGNINEIKDLIPECMQDIYLNNEIKHQK